MIFRKGTDPFGQTTWLCPSCGRPLLTTNGPLDEDMERAVIEQAWAHHYEGEHTMAGAFLALQAAWADLVGAVRAALHTPRP